MSIAELSIGELRDLLETARQLRLHSGAFGSSCSGSTFGVLALRRSLRSRVAFEGAVAQLGGRVATWGADDLGAAWLEAPADLAALLSPAVDGIVASAPHALQVALADSAAVPVLNGQSELESMVDALGVLMTVEQWCGPLRGRRVTYVGDGNQVAHSLLAGGALAGMMVAVAHPRGYAPDPQVVTRAREIAAGTGGAILVTEDPVEALRDAEAVVVEPWDADPQIRKRFSTHRLDARLLERAHPGAIVLHTLPRQDGAEIDLELLGSPRAAHVDLAGNRLHAAKALITRFARGLG